MTITSDVPKISDAWLHIMRRYFLIIILGNLVFPIALIQLLITIINIIKLTPGHQNFIYCQIKGKSCSSAPNKRNISSLNNTPKSNNNNEQR